jgi:hypothetical protein
MSIIICSIYIVYISQPYEEGKVRKSWPFISNTFLMKISDFGDFILLIGSCLFFNLLYRYYLKHDWLKCVPRKYLILLSVTKCKYPRSDSHAANEKTCTTILKTTKHRVQSSLVKPSDNAVNIALWRYSPLIPQMSSCVPRIWSAYVFHATLTLSLLMSYIYGAPCKARNFNVVYIYIYIYGPTFGNAESRLFLFDIQCFNIESMQKTFLCHS